MKKALVCALIFALLPTRVLAQPAFSSVSESFTDGADKSACVLQAITNTHILPKREGDLSGKVGTVVLVARVAADGKIGDLRISRSSNIEALDTFTAGWIKDTWRWKIADDGCPSRNVDLTVYWKQLDDHPEAPKGACVVQAVMRTQTLPPERRGGVSPPVLVSLSIGVDGRPFDLTVIQTSGYSSLDSQAMAWIEKNWLWEPRPADCEPYHTRINMRW